HDRQRIEQCPFGLGFGLGNRDRVCDALEESEGAIQPFCVGDWSAHQCNDFLDGLRLCPCVASGPFFTDEKSDMTNDAVADLAEPRQMNEQALFEQRGERVVQITRLREAPELLDEAGCTRRGTEEVRQYAEARSHFCRELIGGVVLQGSCDPSADDGRMLPGRGHRVCTLSHIRASRRRALSYFIDFTCATN